jgi:hypothetical protein
MSPNTIIRYIKVSVCKSKRPIYNLRADIKPKFILQRYDQNADRNYSSYDLQLQKNKTTRNLNLNNRYHYSFVR